MVWATDCKAVSEYEGSATRFSEPHTHCYLFRQQVLQRTGPHAESSREGAVLGCQTDAIDEHPRGYPLGATAPGFSAASLPLRHASRN